MEEIEAVFDAMAHPSRRHILLVLNDDAALSAHEHPAIVQIWDAMVVVADFVPMKDLPQAAKPFEHFVVVTP